MGDQRESGIAWTDETWNPIRGCTRVSPGCENCYAERTAARFSDYGQAYYGLAVRKLKTLGEGDNGARTVPRWTGHVRTVPEHLRDPLKWKRPRRIFVNSMSDLFHEKLGFERDIDPIFAVMGAAERHTFQVLTKRPKRMLEYVLEYERRVQERIPRNIWLGVTAEDQQRADERIPLLLQTPAAVRFVSVEPQLEHVDLKTWTASWADCPACERGHVGFDEEGCCTACGADVVFHYGLDWVICGAESGPGARPFDEAWARSLRDQCASAGTAFFYKQALDATGHKVSTPEIDGRRWTDFPEVR